MTKYVEELGHSLSGRKLDIWEGRSGLPPTKEEFYRNEWRKEAGKKPKREKCRFFGEPTGDTIPCAPCAGKTRFKLFVCSHRENERHDATLEMADEKVWNCADCFKMEPIPVQEFLQLNLLPVSKDIPEFRPSRAAGVVIGTYGYPKLAAFQVRMIRDTCGDVPILIADDGSNHDAAFEEVVRSNLNVEFWPSDHRRGHYSGDLSVFWKGFQWARNRGLKHLVKLSQRFIITENGWLAKVCKLIDDTGHATVMQNCIDDAGGNIPDCRLFVRSECMAFDVEKWIPYYREFDTGDLNNPTELYIWHRVHAYFGEQYAPWPRMPVNRYEPMPETLWHCTNSENDYRQVAASKGLTLDDNFTCAGGASLPDWKRG